MIVWCSQIIAKAEENRAFAESLFSNLNGMSDFSSTAAEFIADAKSFKEQQFEDWMQDVQAALADGSGDGGLLLETTGRLMDFDHDQGSKLRVHYSDRLVTLLREVRQLGALGCSIPADIRKAAETARKFYRHGIVLKQVAHFYNHMDDQIIFAQLPMLESAVGNLEKIIQQPNTKGTVSQREGRDGAAALTVAWDNAVELEQYVGTLQDAAERLTTENRMLRKMHTEFGEKVSG